MPTEENMNEEATNSAKKSTSEKCNTADTTPLRPINNGEQTSTSALALGYPYNPFFYFLGLKLKLKFRK